MENLKVKINSESESKEAQEFSSSSAGKNQGEPFLTPECTLNDQYAEIEQVRQQTIKQTLAERGSRYGDYYDVASTTQQLIAIIECGASYEHLNAEQKTSLFMICNKIARAVNGDPQYFDNYRDIAGYATLAEMACEEGRPEVIESYKPNYAGAIHE